MAVFVTYLVFIFTSIGSGYAGVENLMAFANKAEATIIATGGTVEAAYHLKYPQQLQRHFTVAPNSVLSYKALTGTASENIAIVIDVDSSSPMGVYGRQNEATFTPLPVSALGNEYVVSSCQKSEGGMSSLLLITAYTAKTNVDIFFDNEQTFTHDGRQYVNASEFSQDLASYDSIVLLSENSFAGSRIVSDHVIAVYSGVIEKSVVTMYTQLLPVSLLGNTFMVYFDESRTTYGANWMGVYSDTSLTSTSIQSSDITSSKVEHYSLRNESMNFTFSKPTSMTLCGTNGLRGMAVLPPIALLQTQVILPLNGDTLVIVHPHLTNSVKVSDRSVQEDIEWDFTDEIHVGVVRTPSVPGQSLVISAEESFYVIAASEIHIYTAGYSQQEQEPPDGDDTNIIFGVAAGSGVSLSATLFVGGAVYIRRWRRRQNRDGGNQADGQGDNYPPALPPPPRVPV